MTANPVDALTKFGAHLRDCATRVRTQSTLRRQGWASADDPGCGCGLRDALAALRAATPTPTAATGPQEPLDVEALAETLYRYYPGPSREHNWSFWQTRARNMLDAMAYHRARLSGTDGD